MWQHLAALGPDVQAELSTLSSRWGTPLIDIVYLGSHSGSFGPRIRERTLRTSGSFAPIGQSDRYGEVCMVVRRKDGRLITARKAYYPTNVHRLLTGGINHGEHIQAALLRETWEETGLAVEIRQFLAAVTYISTDLSLPDFHTFAFLLDEQSGTLESQDPDEEVAEYVMVEPAQLPVIAERLDDLGHTHHSSIKGLWSDWGRFRAVIHTVVAEALNI